MSRRTLVLVAAALALPTPALAADDTRPLDLATAIATALRQNDTVLGEAVEAEAAAADVRALAGADDAVLSAEVGGATRRTEPLAGPFFQETGFDALSIAASLSRPLSTGGRIGLTLRDQVARSKVRLDVGGMPTQLEYTIHGPRAEVVLVQPLLRGRGKRATHAARRAAGAERDAQLAERTGAEAALIHDVTVAYWELAYASSAVAIHDSALALAAGQLEITRARAEVGRGSELEVLAVEQAIAAREAARLAAVQLEIERALDLRVLMAAEDGDRRRFVAAEPLDGPIAAIAVDDALNRAVAFSPELHVLDERTRAAAIQRDLAVQELSPSLDLVLRGGPVGNADAAGEAFAQLATFDSFEASATLTFSLPLGNHAAAGRRDAARLRVKRLGHAHDEVRGHLTASVQRAVDAIALADRRIAAAAKSTELARRNVELEQARWHSGSGTNFDVLARQDQLTAAEDALARAYADRHRAIAGLSFLTGDGFAAARQ